MPRSNTAVDLRVSRRAHFEHLLSNGIRTDEELLSFIEIYLGYSLVNRRSPFCLQHDAPARFVTDQFFDRISSCLGFASRLGGKTLSVALLNICDMLFKPGVEIISAGAIKDQAQKGHEYVIRGYERLAEFFRYANAPISVAAIAGEEIVLTNDSRAKLTAATGPGFNSGHPHRLRCDEIEFLHFDLIQESLSMSQSRDGILAQDTFTSTRKVSTGTMQKLLDKSEDLGFKTISWCVFEVLETCKRKCFDDPVHGNCRAFSRTNVDGEQEPLCAGRAHELPPGGWYSIADFVKKVQNLDRETFEAQWLCIRPNLLQVVYGACYRDEAPFVVEPAEQGEIMRRYRESKQSWVRLYGQDFGSNWALLETIQDPVDDVIYVVWEYFWPADRDRSVSRHAAYMKEHDPLGFSEAEFFGYGDPAGRQVMSDLEEYGIFFVPANNDLYAGVQYIKGLFERRTSKGLPGIRVFSNCTELRRELRQTYIHPQRRDGELERDKFFKRDNHACLVAGTMVMTADGPMPIEMVHAGDSVLTRKGYRRVVAAAATSLAAKVYTVECSTGARLTGTGNHPIWISNRGWTPLDSVMPGDMLFTCDAVNMDQQKRLSSGASSSAVIPDTPIPTCAITTAPARISGVRWARSMWRSGLRRTGQFLRDITSTIEMAIPLTTIWTISSALAFESISVSIANASASSAPSLQPADLLTWRQSGRLRSPGTNRPRGGNGTGRMALRSLLGRLFPKCREAVSSATVSSLRPCLPPRINASVPTPASPHGVEPRGGTRLNVVAPSVTSHSLATATHGNGPAGVHAGSSCADAARSTDKSGVSFAIEPSDPAAGHGPGIVQNADNGAGWGKSRRECVASAVSRSACREDARQSRAVVSVVGVGPSGSVEPVYNLTVAEEHEYFANGVLVSNCDSLRYMLFSHHTIGTASYTTARLRGV